jgi:lipopolysaccharide export system protein LptA
MKRQRIAIALAAAIAAMSAFSARAEKADREKPTQVEANRMTSDEARRISVFEGDVVLTKGTLQLKAERVVVRQDADGFQYATATGDPVHLRQKSDPRAGQEGVWIEGEAGRIEVDGKNERIELHGAARVTRDKDEVRGNTIVYDQRSEFFSVSSSAGAPESRVRAVIQPGTPKPKAPEARKPEARK